MVYHIGNGKENIKYLKNEGTVKLLGCTVPSLYFWQAFIYVNRILPLFRKAFTHFSGKSLSGKHKNMGIVKSCKHVVGFFLILQNDRRA